MTDKRTDVNEVPYEALHNANEGFGDDVLGESGKKVLETKLGNKIVDLYEELQNAHIDPVTGLFTVVRWREEMSRYYEIAKRENKIFSVIIMDLDDFKLANDLYGHLYGNEVLQNFGKAILERFRKGDICGRFGGDEAIVMWTSAKLEPNAITEEEIKLRSELSEKAGVGVSVGIANWDEHSTLDETIKQADDRLLENKKNKKSNV
jgi:diguanylate cyclase (GGDEF)-like protein